MTRARTVKDSDGRVTGWRVRWRNPQGSKVRQPSRTFPKSQKALADMFAAEMQRKLLAGKVGVSVRSALTVSAFYETHVRPTKELETTGKTNEGRHYMWTKWIQPHIGNVPLTKVTPEQLAAVILGPHQERKIDTARRVRNLLIQIWDVAVEMQVVDDNLPRRRKPPRLARVEADNGTAAAPPAAGATEAEGEQSDPVARPDGKFRWLVTDEVQRIIARFSGTNRVMVTVMAFVGLRIGELVALNVGDVDVERGLLVVRTQMSCVAKRFTGGSSYAQRAKTKTSTSTRTIALPAPIVEMIRPLVENRPKGEPLFTTASGCRILAGNWRNRVWRPQLAAAGIPDATPHDLRHYAVSLMYEQGVLEVAIAAYVGHVSPDVTRSIYAHLLAPDSSAVAAAIAAPLGKMLKIPAPSARVRSGGAKGASRNTSSTYRRKKNAGESRRSGGR